MEQQDPREADHLCEVALQSGQQGLWQQAEQQLRAALTADAGHGWALHLLGSLLIERGSPAEALLLLDKALAANGPSAELHNEIAAALRLLNRQDEAIEQYRRSLVLRPDHVPTLDTAVMLLLAARRSDDALALVEEIIAERPQAARAHSHRAHVLAALGRPDEARSAIECALRLEPANGNHHYMLAWLKRFAAGDPQLAAMDALALQPADGTRAALMFARAKAYRDCGQIERAFAILGEANRLARQQYSYDERGTQAQLAQMKAVFSAELLRAKSDMGDPSPVAVIILGMPRSGTSLVEQILASHPDVKGAGETAAFEGEAQRVVPGVPAGMEALTASQLQTIAAGYLARLGAAAGTARRITDKSLGAVRAAGLMHMALPKARFIHVTRDPVDTCLSCYERLFADLRYTNNLAELGRYHLAFEELMAHWHRVFPPDTLLTVRYEDLIGDCEAQTRRMLAHCGLGWDEACLSFHETRRPVFTASADQVRSPLFRSSIGRWRPARATLAPLLEALGPGAS